MGDAIAWELVVGRDDLARTRFLERPLPQPGAGEALLRVDRVGVTANNVTYARLGDAMRYWDFFPTDEGWGRVPLWGFAEVEQSNVEGLDAGARVYGYLPSSSHLIVRPQVSHMGFKDTSQHRGDLPGAYNVYVSSADDPTYRPEHEDLQILYRPLFITSVMLDDFLGDSDFFGAEVVLFSSASSKTAYATAFCTRLRRTRPRLVGLTSSSNVSFTESLGCYDEVASYEEVSKLDSGSAAMYVDVSCNPKLRRTIHDHFEELVYDAVVGMTHDDAQLQAADISGPTPTFFFAPDQIRKRREDWGPGGIEKRYAAAWGEFAPTVSEWVDVKVGRGRDDLLASWLDVLAGRVDPRVGHVVDL